MTKREFFVFRKRPFEKFFQISNRNRDFSFVAFLTRMIRAGSAYFSNSGRLRKGIEKRCFASDSRRNFLVHTEARFLPVVLPIKIELQVFGVLVYRFRWNLATTTIRHHFIRQCNMTPSDDSYEHQVTQTVSPIVLMPQRYFIDQNNGNMFTFQFINWTSPWPRQAEHSNLTFLIFKPKTEVESKV